MLRYNIRELRHSMHAAAQPTRPEPSYDLQPCCCALTCYCCPGTPSAPPLPGPMAAMLPLQPCSGPTCMPSLLSNSLRSSSLHASAPAQLVLTAQSQQCACLHTAPQHAVSHSGMHGGHRTRRISQTCCLAPPSPCPDAVLERQYFGVPRDSIPVIACAAAFVLVSSCECCCLCAACPCATCNATCAVVRRASLLPLALTACGALLHPPTPL